VRVVDMDPSLEGRSREVVVKIAADQKPVPPTRQEFERVEFEGLTVTPRTSTMAAAPAGAAAARGWRSRCALPV